MFSILRRVQCRCTGLLYAAEGRKGPVSCAATMEVDTRVTVLLWDFFLEERLGEMEAWSVLCQGCELLAARLRETEDSRQLPGSVYESFIITDRRLELGEAGLELSEARRPASVRDQLPRRMKPLLELEAADLGRVGVFSLARLVLANIDNVTSAPLYSLLSSILATSLASVPELPRVHGACLEVISSASARRILSSMYYKHQGKCRKDYGARQFSTIRSLPSLALHTNFDEEDRTSSRKMVSCMSHRDLRRAPVYEATRENEQSISGVCDYVRSKGAEATNREDVFSLLELPGLRYNRSSVAEADTKDSNQNNVGVTKDLTKDRVGARINLTKDGAAGHKVRVVLLDCQLVEVELKPREVVASELLRTALDKLHIDPSEFHLFCLCKKLRGEYFYLNNDGKLSDFISSGVSTFHVRLVKPPGIQIRKLYSKFLQETNNFGVFSYEGRESRAEQSEVLRLKLDICGLRINETFVAWRHVKQVTFSHTYIQLLARAGDAEADSRHKVCFSAAKTKFIYDLILYLINANKEVERTKEKELSNLDDLCDQLMKITRTALKVITTPNRKRTKSVEPDLTKSAAKKQKLNPALGFSERKRTKKATAASQYQYQYKLYLENEEDELYVHTDRLQHRSKETVPRAKPRISTNPNIKTEAAVSRQRTLTLPSRSAQPPVIMGTSTLKRKITPNIEAEPKRIVCVSMSKMEYLALKIKLCKKEESLFVDSLQNQMRKKMLIGDKIIAVNGKTLEGCSLEKTNFIISNSGHLLNFILQR